ncbi:MAG: DsbA family protein [Nitriliruptor sp.]
MSTAIELFFDPVCPFCWMTSRWIEEVRPRLDLAVTYRPISLRMLNPDEDPDGAMAGVHDRGLELLRVVVAVAETHGQGAVGPLYTALGNAIHEQPVGQDVTVEGFEDVARVQVDRPADLPGLLRDLGLDEDLASATSDVSRDVAIRASTELALERAGDDVGTPIITFGPPDGPSLFGPILSELPRGDEAVRLFEATRTLAEHRPFTEFKRSLRAMPDVAALARIR